MTSERTSPVRTLSFIEGNPVEDDLVRPHPISLPEKSSPKAYRLCRRLYKSANGVAKFVARHTTKRAIFGPSNVDKLSVASQHKNHIRMRGVGVALGRGGGNTQGVLASDPQDVK